MCIERLACVDGSSVRHGFSGSALCLWTLDSGRDSEGFVFSRAHRQTQVSLPAWRCQRSAREPFENFNLPLPIGALVLAWPYSLCLVGFHGRRDAKPICLKRNGSGVQNEAPGHFYQEPCHEKARGAGCEHRCRRVDSRRFPLRKESPDHARYQNDDQDVHPGEDKQVELGK